VAPGYGTPTAPGTAGGSYPNLRPEVPDGSSAPPVSAPGGYSTAPGYPPALAPPGWAQPGYGQPVQDQTGAGQPNYGSPPDPVQPIYGAQTGYPAQPSYGGQPTYGAQPGYGSQPAYGAQPDQAEHGDPTTQLGVPPQAAGETTEPPESGHDGGHR
jgi:hypothetical protein